MKFYPRSSLPVKDGNYFVVTNINTSFDSSKTMYHDKGSVCVGTFRDGRWYTFPDAHEIPDQFDFFWIAPGGRNIINRLQKTGI